MNEKVKVCLRKGSTLMPAANKNVLFSQTHAEETLAKADAALRQRETELATLRAEHQALQTELNVVRRGLSSSTERAEQLHEEGQVGI